MATVSTPWHRYLETFSMTTRLDVMSDLRTQVSFYASQDFAAEAAIRHGAPAIGAGDQAKEIVAHVRAALQFIDQAIDSMRTDAALVSAYYAGLNLLKACVALSTRHAELNHEKHRRHGASRDTPAVQPAHLFDDEVRLFRDGSLALGYEVLTGRPATDRTVRLKDVYCGISVVGAEMEVIGIEPSWLFLRLQERDTFGRGPDGPRSPALIDLTPSGAREPTLEDLTFLRDRSVWRHDAAGQSCTGPEVASWSELRDLLDTTWLFLPDEEQPAGAVVVANSPITPPFPQEFYLLVSFFHLAHVVRYEPAFLYKLKQTRQWPVVEAVKAHGLAELMRLFCSFAMQKAIVLNAI